MTEHLQTSHLVSVLTGISVQPKGCRCQCLAHESGIHQDGFRSFYLLDHDTPVHWIGSELVSAEDLWHAFRDPRRWAIISQDRVGKHLRGSLVWPIRKRESLTVIWSSAKGRPDSCPGKLRLDYIHVSSGNSQCLQLQCVCCE